MTEHDFILGDEDRPLVPSDCGSPDEHVVYDETGALTMARLGSPVASTQLGGFGEQFRIPITRPCSLAALDGSWNLSFRPKSGRVFLGSLRGPMRLEADAGLMRVSGDMYFKSFFVRSPIGTLLALDEAEEDAQPTFFRPFWRRNWYPHYPFEQYRWYFRSTGVSYSGGELFVPFVRHLWNTSTQQFEGSDSGWLRLRCEQSIILRHQWLQPTLQIAGEAMIGGQLHTATATKTSPYYRGSVVEVDAMENRPFPTSAAGTSFANVYRTAGIDLAVKMSRNDVPEDPELTTTELHNLLTAHRDIADIGSSWYMWLFVGSKRLGSNTFGLMFDQQAPHREGAVGYYDAEFNNSSLLEPAVKNQALGDVPAGFLRTLVHEAGHAFNLFHPKADVHAPSIGTTVMNQTGDVMSLATTGNLYPSNITWGFNDHNRTSLIHSPDPQVAPGWKEFGWGHGSSSAGLSEPTDALGLRRGGPDLDGLDLAVSIPNQAVRGEFVTAEITVSNTSDGVRRVSRHLNLADGDLDIGVTTPSGHEARIRDVVHLCGHNDAVDLAPGESVSSTIQLFYANCGHVFDAPGRYRLAARLVADAASDTIVESEPVTLMVELPATKAAEKRAELTMDDSVGLSFALGDFGTCSTSGDKLKQLATAEAGTDTGTAAALVLANSYSRTLRDASDGEVVRRASSRDVSDALTKAMKVGDTTRVARLACAVVSPGETTAPVLDALADRIKGSRAKAKQDERDDALAILSDFADV